MSQRGNAVSGRGALPLREAVMQGTPRAAGARVIDAHAHIGPWFNFRIAAPYADGMLRTMDVAGVDVAWITADAAIGPDFQLGNDLVAEAVADHPDRFRGYITVNPHYPRESHDELARRREQGWGLIKLHPGTHLHPADGPGYALVWEFAQEHGLHVLSHSFPTPERLARVAQEHPDVSILVGHAASDPLLLPDLYGVCAAHPNVFLDLCGSVLWRGLLEQMVAGAGASRVLYGSDIPFIDPRPQIGRVAFARLPEDDLRAILGDNAQRIWQRVSGA